MEKINKEHRTQTKNTKVCGEIGAHIFFCLTVYMCSSSFWKLVGNTKMLQLY